VLTRRVDAPLPDLRTVRFVLTVDDAAPATALSVALELRHSYIGDLVITLHPPTALGLAPVVLHERSGGGRKSLKKVYDANTTPALQAVAGRSCAGRWTLSLRDAAAQDSGILVGWGMRLLLSAAPAPGQRGARSSAKRDTGSAPGKKKAATKKVAASVAKVPLLARQGGAAAARRA
jgi:subtilisin-like proprotein convertase family protein